MEGQEADDKHQHHDDDHAGRLVPLLPPGLPRPAALPAAQHPRHEAVAHHHGQEGQQEAQAGEGDAVGEVLPGAIGHTQVVADGAVALGARGGKLEGGHAEDRHGQPHANAHSPCQPAATLLVPGGHGVADAQVALEADAREEENGAVQVAVELEAHQAAGQVPEGPVVMAGVVEDEEGQGTDVQEVGHSQVQHIDLATGQRLAGPPDEKDDGEVEREAQHEHQAVDGREEVTLKVLIVGARGQCSR